MASSAADEGGSVDPPSPGVSFEWRLGPWDCAAEAEPQMWGSTYLQRWSGCSRDWRCLDVLANEFQEDNSGCEYTGLERPADDGAPKTCMGKEECLRFIQVRPYVRSMHELPRVGRLRCCRRVACTYHACLSMYVTHAGRLWSVRSNVPGFRGPCIFDERAKEGAALVQA